MSGFHVKDAVRRFTAAGVAAAALMIAPAAQALVININAKPGGGLDIGSNAALAMAAFNRAADQWESRFSDNVTVEINADILNLGSGSVIGNAGSTMLKGAFNTIRNRIKLDAADETDDAITASLPSWTQFKSVRPTGIGVNDAISLTQANAMALGFARVTASDATINFNSGFSFDYDNSDGVVGMDFETVALHEIGHALGFVSVVDIIDKMKAEGKTGKVTVNPMDLFRFGYGANPAAAEQFKTFSRQLKPGASAFFDDLEAQLRLSTGAKTGDGRQASHWRDDTLSGSLLGVMDPTLALASILPLTENDLRLLDVIGWDYLPSSEGSGVILTSDGASLSGLSVDAAFRVQEPPVLPVLVLSLLGLGYFQRRKHLTA